jgi:pimeloyl-ACP methyl ester carboxylesterase
MAHSSREPIHFELHGRGIPLVLSHPFRASPTHDDPERMILRAYLERLTDRFRVLVMDYPNGGGRESVPAGELTMQRVYTDVLSVADAAGFGRFLWWGYSWGGAVGVQLASRTDRIVALVCGGWSPLGGLHQDLLRASRALGAEAGSLRHTYTFYESLQHWSEIESVRRIAVPALAYAGTRDETERGGIRIEIAARLHEYRRALEDLGWCVAEIEGKDHAVWKEPEIAMDIVRPFLDRVSR